MEILLLKWVRESDVRLVYLRTMLSSESAPKKNRLTDDYVEKLFDYCVGIRFNQVVAEFHLKIRDYRCYVVIVR